MKLIFSLLMLFSSSAFAAHEIVIANFPERPFMMNALTRDRSGSLVTTLTFHVFLQFDSQSASTITIEKVRVRAKSEAGIVTDKTYGFAPLEIPSGGSSGVDIDVEGIEVSPNSEFDVTVEAIGYEGTVGSPGRVVTARHVFKTQ